MANSNLYEFYSAEGTSEEEWKRVYDLRYCTILVPFENDSHPKENQDSPDSQTEQVKQEPEELKKEDGVSEVTMSSFVSKKTTPELVHLATPRATPARPEPKEPQGAVSTPTPQPRKKELDTDDQDHDMMTDDQVGLTEHDPLSRYLTADTHPRTSPELSPKNPDMDMSEDDDDAETECFHDAATGLEMDETAKNLDIHQQESSRQHKGRGGDDDSADCTSSTGSDNNKRKRHWELSPLQRLLQPVDPHPSKRIALSLSPLRSQGAKSISSASLLRPRSFSPSISPSPYVWVTPPTAESPEQSDTSWVATGPTFWRKLDWMMLEELYDELKGESLEESELEQIVDRFLAKHDTAEGGKPKWSREFVLLRCVALHRVRVQETPDAMSQELYPPTLSSRPNSRRGVSLVFSNRIGTARRSVSPYPVGLGRRAGSSPPWSSGPASPGSIADFVDERRADRARQQRSADQGSQIKSVFKHRFAAGLKTVGELLPFWKDVENGHTDVKEEVVVPLVPAGRALSVIAAFESQAVQAQERQLSVPMRSRSGSVLSTTASWNPERMGRSLSPAPSSFAELIGRGHAVRAASASGAATASTTCPPANGSPTQTSD